MNHGPHIVISGYYGFGNAGDEAVLAGLVDTFRAAIPGAALAVASADPESTRALHGVDAFDRYRWIDFHGQMRGCDAFVSGGGSLFQDVTSRRSIYYYLGTIALAEMYRKPVMVCGQGIGPIHASAARTMTGALLNRTRIITVRDADSLDTLKALGVTRPHIELTADPVFALAPGDPEEASLTLRREGVDMQTPRVAFALRSWPPRPDPADGHPASERTEPGENEALVAAAAEAAAFVHNELGAQPIFLPMHVPDDRAIARAVAERAGVPTTILAGGYPPRQTLAIVGRMDMVFGMRLHALIFAAAQGVPLVGLSYDPKVDGFLASLGRTPAADLASINGGALISAIRHAWDRRMDDAPLLRQKSAELRERALANGVLLSSLVATRAGV